MAVLQACEEAWNESGIYLALVAREYIGSSAAPIYASRCLLGCRRRRQIYAYVGYASRSGLISRTSRVVTQSLQDLVTILGIFIRDDKVFIFIYLGVALLLRRVLHILHIRIWICIGVLRTGALDGIQGDAEEVDADVDADHDSLGWTVIDIPVWKVVEIVLPTELDLAVVISCVPIFILVSHLNSYCVCF